MFNRNVAKIQQVGYDEEVKKIFYVLLLIFLLFAINIPNASAGTCDQREACPIDQYPTCDPDVGRCARPDCGEISYNSVAQRYRFDCAHPASTPTFTPGAPTPTPTSSASGPTPTPNPGRCLWQAGAGGMGLEAVDSCSTGFVPGRPQNPLFPEQCVCVPTGSPNAMPGPLVAPPITIQAPPPPCEQWTDLNGVPIPTTDPRIKQPDATKKCAAVKTGLDRTINTDPVNFVKSIFGIILSLSGGVALLLVILSGYKLMLSQGNPEKAQEARETLTAAVVGLLFIIFSLVILQVIGVDILRIPGFEK